MILHSKAAEAALISHLPTISLEKNSIGIIFNLSKLSINKENNEHITIATNILNNHLRGVGGGIYLFTNGDIIVFIDSKNSKLAYESVYQLRYLFADDPLSYHSSGRENDEFCTTFFSNDWQEFIGNCKTKVANLNIEVLQAVADVEEETLFELISSHVEASLSQVNWSNVIKLNPICLIGRNKQAKKIINHINIDLESLRQEIRENLDIVHNQNLFNFVREVIDLRLLIKLLNEIRQNHLSIAHYVNLSIATLESEEFEIFNEGIAEADRRNLIIGVHISDVFRELSEFLRLKQKLVQYGFKLCLHGLDVRSFLMIDRQALGFDLLKIKWQPDVFKQDYIEYEQEIRNKIQATGVSRVIFGGCDTSNAFTIGQRLGINIFQGKILSRLAE